MKVVGVFLIFLVATQASIIPKLDFVDKFLFPKVKFTPKDFQGFLLGFAKGLQFQIGVNVSKCQGDIVLIERELTAAIADLKTGFSQKNVQAIYRAFKELGTAMDEIALSLKECGVEKIAEDISKLAAELASPDGLIKVLIQEALTIFHHKTDITANIKDLITSWQSKNYGKGGEDLGRIVGVLLEPEVKKLDYNTNSR